MAKKKQAASGNKAGKTTNKPTSVETVKHQDARTNIPTRAQSSMVTDDEAAPINCSRGLTL